MNGHNPTSLQIAVVGRPRMLREVLVEVARKETDMELVTEVEDVGDLLRPSNRRKLDAAILIAQAEDARRIGEMVLRRFPAMKVAVVFDNGRNGELYELKPCVRCLPEVSTKELFEAIRSSVRESSALPLPARDMPAGCSR